MIVPVGPADCETVLDAVCDATGIVPVSLIEEETVVERVQLLLAVPLASRVRVGVKEIVLEGVWKVRVDGTDTVAEKELDL